MMELDKYATGERMRQIRRKKGFRQYEAAEMIGTCNEVLSTWECGHKMPYLENFVKLAQLYGVKMEDLIVLKGGDDNDK